MGKRAYFNKIWGILLTSSLGRLIVALLIVTLSYFVGFAQTEMPTDHATRRAVQSGSRRWIRFLDRGSAIVL